MISTRHKFIFLHAPKTAGNAVQTLLLPFSDERKVTSGFQDGTHRFELRSAHTRHKHVSLADYAKGLGAELDTYHLAITLRDPFERMVSFYFSPHRWRGDPPFLTETAFVEAMARLPKISDLLTVAGEVRRPDSVLRFPRLQTDFDRLHKKLGLPGAPPQLPRLNTSSGTPALIAEAMASAGLRRAVEAAFASDYTLINSIAPDCLHGR